MLTSVVGLCGTRPAPRTPQPAGLRQQHTCLAFKPRPSAYRLCRKAKSQSLICTASSASQPLQPAKPSPVHTAVATVAYFWQHSLQRVASFLHSQRAKQEPQPKNEELNAQIRASIKKMKCLAAVAPFAAVNGSSNTFILVTQAVGSFIRLYLLLLFLRVLLSWFPSFGWERQPWLALRQVTDPYLNLFRGLVPPLLGTIDFTPLFGFFILQFLEGTLDLGAEDEW